MFQHYDKYVFYKKKHLMQIESADCRFPFRHLIVNTYLIHNKISIFLDKEFCSGHFF